MKMTQGEHIADYILIKTNDLELKWKILSTPKIAAKEKKS